MSSCVQPSPRPVLGRTRGAFRSAPFWCATAAFSAAAITVVFEKSSAILHAEMDALENAGRQPAQVYRESVLYTTLSPCAMCTGAILLYGIPQVIIGENETFRGEEDLLLSRGARLQVLQDSECIRLMRDFLAAKPGLWREDIGV